MTTGSVVKIAMTALVYDSTFVSENKGWCVNYWVVLAWGRHFYGLATVYNKPSLGTLNPGGVGILAGMHDGTTSSPSWDVSKRL